MMVVALKLLGPGCRHCARAGGWGPVRCQKELDTTDLLEILSDVNCGIPRLTPPCNGH